MLQPTTLNPADISPWPPVLHFTAEVLSGITAATILADPLCDVPMCELTSEQLVMLVERYMPELV